PVFITFTNLLFSPFCLISHYPTSPSRTLGGTAWLNGLVTYGEPQVAVRVGERHRLGLGRRTARAAFGLDKLGAFRFIRYRSSFRFDERNGELLADGIGYLGSPQRTEGGREVIKKCHLFCLQRKPHGHEGV